MASKIVGFLCTLLLVTSLSFASAPKPELLETSFINLMKNVSYPGTAKGSIIASPSTTNPNYFFHWVRDAGLVMESVITAYENAKSASEKEVLLKSINDYIQLNRRLQKTPNPSGGLGEPKFHVDGSAFTGSWGRPQDDGPALRAIGLIRVANLFINEGKIDLARELYSSSFDSIIKADLEYVSHHWRNTCFDLWEESRGHHFYTRMVQRKSLIEGSKLAIKLGDPYAADWYLIQARYLEGEMEKHWMAEQNYLTVTINQDAGIFYKKSGLDAAVILAVLHGYAEDGFYSYSNERVLSTAIKIENAFRDLYPINRKGRGTAIGRYPEDVYDGYGWGEGNPWFINTHAFAELHYKVAREINSKGVLNITSVSLPFYQRLGVSGLKAGMTLVKSDPLFFQVREGLVNRGDDFMARSKLHMDASGSMSEQMNRHSGFMQGARDLTWSYASYVTAAQARP